MTLSECDIPSGGRVVVAMSGGVDSSVVAALLASQGYQVIGITLQLYDHGRAINRPGSCCAGQDIHDARRVADRLGIDHYVLDYQSRFRSHVIDAFADSYARGETPIPCVQCNQFIKFEELLRTARELGADALATGHYVRRERRANAPALFCGRESSRDQSYFLFATTRDQLSYLRFPLGGMHKEETRALAERLGLAEVAHKRDSQDICFVPTGGYADVLERLRPDANQPGEIVDLAGSVLGQHNGIGHFTVGQRRGLGISATEPLYVIRLEPQTARVVVGPVSALKRTRVVLRDVNWMGDADLPVEDVCAHVKLRSTMTAVPASVDIAADRTALVTLVSPHGAISPGQACVFYDDDRVLGGGWITGSH